MRWLTREVEDEEGEQKGDEDEDEEEEAGMADEAGDADGDVDDFLDCRCSQLHDEVALRQPRGEWA